MKIYTDTPEGVTVVRNSFIDQFMPQANGEFVKVYLYLLRCANTGRDLSLSSIADALEHTEKDVRRALAYWEKQDLIHLKAGQDGELLSVTFSDLPSEPEEPKAPGKAEPLQTPAGSAGPAQAFGGPDLTAPSREKAAALSQQKEIRQLFFIAEQYLQRPLTSGEQNDFIYYYDTLKFSVDLIEYLVEYCVSKGSASRHYMRTVALAWAEAGISTVTQAKQESSLYNKNYYIIFKAFGIKGRNPAQAEMETMSRWFDEFSFSIDLVLEACNRTIRTIHQPSFEYANRILKDWHSRGVTSLEDVKQLDQQRTEDRKRRETAKKPSPQKSQNNRFNNFSQREYDYSQLEKQLLNS